MKPQPPAQKFLVVDDLSHTLREHPILIPIPPSVLSSKSNDTKLKQFTIQVYRDLMKLPYFKDWYHHAGDIVIDGFSVRWNKIYPSISS